MPMGTNKFIPGRVGSESDGGRWAGEASKTIRRGPHVSTSSAACYGDRPMRAHEKEGPRSAPWPDRSNKQNDSPRIVTTVHDRAWRGAAVWCMRPRAWPVPWGWPRARAIASRPRMGATTLTDLRCAPALMGALRSPRRLVSDPLRSVDPRQQRNEFHPSAARPRAHRDRELADAILAGRCVPLPPAPGHRLPHLPAPRAPAGRLLSADTGRERPIAPASGLTLPPHTTHSRRRGQGKRQIALAVAAASAAGGRRAGGWVRA
jgi:hypothetical protein